MSNKHEFKNSSSISHIDYDDNAGCMEIKFSSGATHRYEDCPKDHYHAMKTAESAGKYFHANIRGKFENSRIDN